MTKHLLKLFLLIVICLNTGYGAENKESTSSEIQAINFDLGYGAFGVSAGLGYRYSFLGLSVGVAGLTNDVPAYSLIPPNSQTIFSPNSPLPAGYESKKYYGLIVTGDLTGYYDLNEEFTLFGSVGIYAQQDSVLAVETKSDLKYFYKVENSTGLCFGLGGSYAVSEWINLGLAYHTKRGLFAQIAYYW